jgi:hypothetical protein
MTTLTLANPFLWALFLLLKSSFFGGWFVARWLAWLLSPIWVTAAAIGAASGFLADK